MPLIYRDEQGVDLTAAQVDANFRFLEAIYDALVANPPTAVSITNITVTGNQMTIWFSDASSAGPFTLPMASFHWRAEGFLPDTLYQIGDFLPVGSSIYLVLQNHVTGDEFDSGAENSDEPIYRQIWGPLSQTFSTTVNANQTQRQITQQEAGGYFRSINSAGLEVIVAPSSGTVDDEFHFYQATDGPITFVVSDPSVTINPISGHLKQTAGRGRAATLKCVATNNWDLFGGLAVGEEEYET